MFRRLFFVERLLAPPNSRRGIVHIPAMAAMTKLAGMAALKKVAVSKILLRVGPDKALHDLRKLNAHLRQRSEGVPYTAEVADAADRSLAALERSLETVKGEERVQRFWSWYQSLEKKNPTLADAVFKTWLEVLPGMRWANVVLKGTPAPQQVASGSDLASDAAKPPGDSDPSISVKPRDQPPVGSDKHAAATEQMLRRSHPEVFADYHVILVPRGEESASGAKVGAEKAAAERLDS
jgi:hypothetical protein